MGETPAGLVRRDARVDEHSRWVAFDVPASGDVIYVAQIEGRAPQGSLALATDIGEVGVWRYPHDPALPGLLPSVTPGGLTPMIQPVAPRVDNGIVTLVSLQPLERAVVRVGASGCAVYVKVVPPWRVSRIAENYRRAHEGGVPVAEVLDVDDTRGLILLTELTGSTLADHLETGGPIPDAQQVWDVIERTVTAVGTHGDLHDRQLLVDDRGSIVGVVDLDDAGKGDLLDDLGRLIAHVAIRGVTHPEQHTRVADVVHDLTTIFERRVDPTELRQRITTATIRLMSLRRAHGEPAM